METDFGDLIPLLACSDIEAEHDFLVSALGFASAELERLPNGSVVHAEVRAGAHRIWLHRESDADSLASPGTGPSRGGIVVHVTDVDAHHRRARDAGAEILYEPRDEEYGQREYGLRDPEGHLWWIATPAASPATR